MQENLLQSHRISNITKKMSDWFPPTRTKPKITTKTNQEMHVGGISHALEKAFLTTFNEILLSKLHLYGIQGKRVHWFTLCLTNRKLEVEITASNSP
jgi:hypothetical protein